MRKQLVITGLLSIFFIGTACKKKDNATVEVKTNAENAPVIKTEKSGGFDITSVPTSDKDLGQFPYFTIPEWLSDKSSYGGDRNTDTGKLEVFTGKDFYPVEGKVFVKSYNMHDPNDAGRSVWDEYKFVK